MSSYRLAEGVIFQEDAKDGGGMLSIPYPRRLIRLSSSGCRALRRACGLEDTAGECETDIMNFARMLEMQGILIRVFAEFSERQLPPVTVIIPTYNRGPQLEKCLASLLELDYPRNKLEIIVVDDASEVPVEVCKPVSVIRMAANAGPGAARNTAVRIAKGEILAFMDDDCLADRLWLKDLVVCFQDCDVAAVGGQVAAASVTGVVERYEISQSPLNMGKQQRLLQMEGAHTYLATCNLLVRKQAYLSVGGFTPHLRVGEDVDLCWRLMGKAGLIYYLPRGIVYHYHRAKLSSFMGRRFCYAQSEASLANRFPGKRRQLHYFPGHVLLFGFVLPAWLLAGPWPALAGVLLLAAGQLLWQCRRKERETRNGQCNVGWRTLVSAVLKSQCTAVYLFCRQFSRYYSIPCGVLMAFLSPELLALELVMLFLPAFVQFRLKRPPLDIARFCLLFMVEDIAYQAGVYRGCIKYGNWRPLMVHPVRVGEHK